MNIPTLQSRIGGRWIGQQAAQTLRSAVNGRPVYATHAEAIDFGEALHHAYQGELEYHYNEKENLLRVVWAR